jgi:hypothetical protein
VSATSLGGLKWNASNSSVVGADGSTWTSAEFYADVVLDPGGPGEVAIPLVGEMDSLVARFDPAGALEMVVHVESTTRAAIQRLVLTEDGFVAVGSFDGEATFGRGEAAETTLVETGLMSDLFVARYERSGLLRWARRAGGAINDYPGDAVLLADGDVVVVGMYQADATFGAGEAAETVLALPDGAVQSAFLARFGADGDLVWAQAVSGSVGEEVNGIGVDAAGTLVAVGHIGPGQSVFGAGQPNEVAVASDSTTGWIGRWQSDGALVRVDETGFWVPAAVSVAPDGASAVTGHFYGSAALGEGLPSETLLTSPATDLVLARYDPAGALVWARQTLSVEDAHVFPLRVALAPDGGAIVVGRFDGVGSQFGPGEPAEQTLLASAAPYDPDAFAARFDATGAFVCAFSFGVPGAADFVADLAPRPDGSWLLSGTYGGPVVLGAGQANEVQLVPVAGNDAFGATFVF